jgi:hypothetical protein
MQKAESSTVDNTLDTRNSSHGDYHEQAEMGEAIRGVMSTGKNWRSLTTTQRDALIMLSVKMSRILTGNPDVADHWHDIQGYARLAERELL